MPARWKFLRGQIAGAGKMLIERTGADVEGFHGSPLLRFCSTSKELFPLRAILQRHVWLQQTINQLSLLLLGNGERNAGDEKRHRENLAHESEPAELTASL